MKKRSELKRLSHLKELMAKDGVGALLVTRREDVRYLTGFTGSSGSLLVAARKPCLITDFRYQLQARREAAGATIHIQRKDFFMALHDVTSQMGIKTLWFDESSLTVEIIKKLKKVGLRARGHRDFPRQLRLRKDAAELANIRTAIRRAEESFRELKHFIKPGVSERELGLKLEYIMREKGSRKAAFDTIVASARNGAMPHASVTNRRIKTGDLVTFDFGAEAHGYFCDITRTLCVGQPTPRQKEIHQIVVNAQTEAMDAICLGMDGKLADNAAREVIRKAGYGKYFGHGTGHGVGLMVHEGPTLSPLSQDKIESNMVFTVEPGIYVPGWGGVRIEDMLVATDRGAKILTTLPRELDILKRI